MEAFLPSEIGRLIYGYLHKHCGQNFADEFSKSCEAMEECRRMKQMYSRNFHTTVQDLTLEAILDQYSKLCSLIFKYTNENEHVHRNVLNLLEKILNERQVSSSTVSNNQVFKDVQNLPLTTVGLENKVSKISKTSTDSSVVRKNVKKVSRVKKKTTVPIPSVDHESICSYPSFNDSDSLTRGILKQVTVKLNNDSKETQKLTPNPNEFGIPRTNSSNLILDVSSDSPSEKYQESIFDRSKDAEISPRSISYFPNSPKDSDTNHSNEIEISYSPVETKVTEDVEMESTEDSLTLDLSPSNSRRTSINNSNPEPRNSDSGKISSEMKASYLLIESPGENIRSSQKVKDLFGFNKRSSSSSGRLISLSSDKKFSTSSGNSSSSFDNNSLSNSSLNLLALNKKSETETSVIMQERENGKSQSLNDPKEEGEISSPKSLIVTTPEEEKRNFSASNAAEEKSFSSPPSKQSPKRGGETHNLKLNVELISRKTDVPVLSEECRNIFESLSKSFKFRSSYYSPAKCRESSHQAALSPFSKMFVTPTKPNSIHRLQPNVLPVSNKAGTSPSICQDLCSTFPSELNDNMTLKVSQNTQISMMKSVSKVRIDKKKCLKKMAVKKKAESGEKLKESLRSNLPPKIRIKQKYPAECKVTPKLAAIKASEEKSVKDENTSNLEVSSSSEKTWQSTKETRPNNSIRVFVRETNEIAELDLSSEFVIYHRDSHCAEEHFSSRS